MTIYDYFIAKMAIENELKSETSMRQWANPDGECSNSTKYFKKAEGDGCVFKTTDGVWWDISDILNPVIALSKKDMDDYNRKKETDGVGSFKFVTSFDPVTGAFRTNDLNYEISVAGVGGNYDKVYEIQKVLGKDCDDSDIICRYKRGNVPECTDTVTTSCVKLSKTRVYGEVTEKTYRVYNSYGARTIMYQTTQNAGDSNVYKSHDEITNPDGSKTSNNWALDSEGQPYKYQTAITYRDNSSISFGWEKDSKNNIYQSSYSVENSDGSYKITNWQHDPDNNDKVYMSREEIGDDSTWTTTVYKPNPQNRNITYKYSELKHDDNNECIIFYDTDGKTPISSSLSGCSL